MDTVLVSSLTSAIFLAIGSQPTPNQQPPSLKRSQAEPDPASCDANDKAAPRTSSCSHALHDMQQLNPAPPAAATSCTWFSSCAWVAAQTHTPHDHTSLACCGAAPSQMWHLRQAPCRPACDRLHECTHSVCECVCICVYVCVCVCACMCMRLREQLHVCQCTCGCIFAELRKHAAQSLCTCAVWPWLMCIGCAPKEAGPFVCWAQPMHAAQSLCNGLCDHGWWKPAGQWKRLAPGCATAE